MSDLTAKIHSLTTSTQTYPSLPGSCLRETEGEKSMSDLTALSHRPTLHHKHLCLLCALREIKGEEDKGEDTLSAWQFKFTASGLRPQQFGKNVLAARNKSFGDQQ